MWTIFKVSIKFVTILFLFYVLVFWSQGIWDLSSPTRDWTHSRTPCIEKWSLRQGPPEKPPSPFSVPWYTSSFMLDKQKQKLQTACFVSFPFRQVFLFFFFPHLWFYFVEPFPVSTEIFRNIPPNCVHFPLPNTLHFPAFLAVGCGHVTEVLANGRQTKLIRHF